MNRRERRRKDRAHQKNTEAAIKKARQAGAVGAAEGDIPDWIYKKLEEAERGTPPGELPTIVVQPRGAPPKDALLIARAGDFLEHARSVKAADYERRGGQ